MVGSLQPVDDVGHFGQHLTGGPAPVAGQLAPDQVQRLNAVGALVDRQDAGVAVVLRRAGFFDKAHAAVDLHPGGGDFAGDVGAPALDDRGQQIDPALGARGFIAVRVSVGHVDVAGGVVGEAAKGLNLRFHQQQVAAHIRVLDDAHAVLRRAADFGRLHPVLGVGQSVLEGAFGDAQSLNPDAEPRVIHHGEHARHAAVFRPDQVAHRAAVVAVLHDAGGAGVDAEFFFELDAFGVVACAEAAVVVDQELWHDEQGDALGARRGVGGPGQHQVDDVLGQVVLAESDVNLLPENAIGAVGLRFCAGLERADIRAGVGLGQVHGAGPLTGDHALEEGGALLG